MSAAARGSVIAAALALLALGASGGWWWANHLQQPNAADFSGPSTAVKEKSVLYWYDPMRPDQHFERPGKSPFMDMALVPKYADADQQSTMSIDPRLQQNLGLRRARVARISLMIRVDATGLVALNTRDVAIEQARVGGFVERVWPFAVGDIVTAGQPIAELFVPAWHAAELEYLAVVEGGDSVLIAAARERLLVLGMSTNQIRRLEQIRKPTARFVLRSSRSGVIQRIEVRAGMTLMSGQTLLEVNGLQSVWVEIAVPEAAAPSLQIGTHADLIFSAMPGERYTGKIAAVLPLLSDTRSLRVRVELPNPDGRLRPGMSAQVSLLDDVSRRQVLAVPAEAVIRTGKRAHVVAIDDAGTFMPREVNLGQEVGDWIEIKAGVNEGDTVVASAQFLLDSEASLRGAFPSDADDVDAPEQGQTSVSGARAPTHGAAQ